MWDITQEGDIETAVHSFDRKDGKYYYDVYEDYFEPDEITEITQEEYSHVFWQLKKFEELQSQIDTIIKSMINNP
ncbi:hypothetical protein [Carnobacterium jeotgali]|uniref:hypothetical protein n=1 Tax=Carnobacterium jeotgali TaxID=545534 RepID=UPI00388E44A4